MKQSIRGVPVDVVPLSAAASLNRAAQAEKRGPAHVHISVEREKSHDIVILSCVTHCTMFVHRTILPKRYKYAPAYLRIHGQDVARLDNLPMPDANDVLFARLSPGKKSSRWVLTYGDSNAAMRVNLLPGSADLKAAASNFESSFPKKGIVHVGITGTRKGVSSARMSKLEKQLCKIMDQTGKDIDLHHGDCVGVDADAHSVAVKLGQKVTLHPPDNKKLRAHKNHWRCTFEEPKPYLERNKDIVNQSKILIGMPIDPNVKSRGGTWSTIDYARKQGVKTILI